MVGTAGPYRQFFTEIGKEVVAAESPLFMPTVPNSLAAMAMPTSAAASDVGDAEEEARSTKRGESAEGSTSATKGDASSSSASKEGDSDSSSTEARATPEGGADRDGSDVKEEKDEKESKDESSDAKGVLSCYTNPRDLYNLFSLSLSLSLSIYLSLSISFFVFLSRMYLRDKIW